MSIPLPGAPPSWRSQGHRSPPPLDRLVVPLQSRVHHGQHGAHQGRQLLPVRATRRVLQDLKSVVLLRDRVLEAPGLILGRCEKVVEGTLMALDA